MRKIKVLQYEIRMLSKETKGTLEKLKKILTEYSDGVLYPNKTRNGLFSTFVVSRSERLVMDSTGIFYFMQHEKYNGFLQKR